MLFSGFTQGAAAPASGAAPAGASSPAAAAPAAGGGSGAVPGPQNGTSVLLKMGKPTLYVLAYATDPITTTFVAYEAALMLQHKLRPSVDDWVLPEPAWTIGDYSTQCENDPKTLGAFVIYDVENDSGIVNAVVIQDSFTHLFVRALFISCTQFTTTFDKDKDKEPQGLRSSAITITATGTTSAPPADGQVDF
jgi:hypothetical protein